MAKCDRCGAETGCGKPGQSAVLCPLCEIVVKNQKHRHDVAAEQRQREEQQWEQCKKKFEQTPMDDQQKNFSGFTCLFAVMWLVGVIIAVLVIPEVFDRVNMWDVMVIGGVLTGSVVIGWLLMSRK